MVPAIVLPFLWQHPVSIALRFHHQHQHHLCLYLVRALIQVLVLTVQEHAVFRSHIFIMFLKTSSLLNNKQDKRDSTNVNRFNSSTQRYIRRTKCLSMCTASANRADSTAAPALLFSKREKVDLRKTRESISK